MRFETTVQITMAALALVVARTFASSSYTIEVLTDSTSGIMRFNVPPIINDAGDVAYIATDSNGDTGAYLRSGGKTRCITSRLGSVSFMTQLSLDSFGNVALSAYAKPDDTQRLHAIYVDRQGRLEKVVETGNLFTSFDEIGLIDDVTCPPKTEPGVMRVPMTPGRGQETLEDETQTTFTGSDHQQAS